MTKKVIATYTPQNTISSDARLIAASTIAAGYLPMIGADAPSDRIQALAFLSLSVADYLIGKIEELA